MVPARTDSALRVANRRFYDPLWADADLVDPERFNTWPLVASLLRPGQRRLEVGPGLRLQKRLALADGLSVARGVDEIFIVCRKSSGGGSRHPRLTTA